MKIKWKIIITIVIVLLLLFGLFLLISPLILMSMEDTILKDELDNGYINADYSGWQVISVPEIGEFKIPNDWNLDQHGNLYTISSKDGECLAQGAVLASEDEEENFFDGLVGFDTEEIAYEYADYFVTLGGSDFYKCIVSDDTNEERFNCVYLQNGDAYLMLAFGEKCGIEYAELFEIAEAIVYSYHTRE